jgi:hypothetical protein
LDGAINVIETAAHRMPIDSYIAFT